MQATWLTLVNVLKGSVCSFRAQKAHSWLGPLASPATLPADDGWLLLASLSSEGSEELIRRLSVHATPWPPLCTLPQIASLKGTGVKHHTPRAMGSPQLGSQRAWDGRLRDKRQRLLGAHGEKGREYHSQRKQSSAPASSLLTEPCLPESLQPLGLCSYQAPAWTASSSSYSQPGPSPSSRLSTGPPVLVSVLGPGVH